MKKVLSLLALLVCVCSGAWATPTVVGYTEAINGTKLDGRVFSNGGLENLTISSTASFGSNITDYKGTSKNVIIDATTYASTDSWRKSQNGTYEGQNVGYTLTVGSGYKMNVSKVNARIAVADDTYTWYVEILNSSGVQVWKSSERTSKKTGTSGVIDNVDVSDKDAIQGLTGTITVNLWVKQGGSTKYFCINYLQLAVELEEDLRTIYTINASVADGQSSFGSIDKAGDNSVPEGDGLAITATANTGYGFVNWTQGGSEVSTNPTLTLSDVNADASYVANFKKLYKATFDLGTYGGTIENKVLCSYNAGSNINEIYADIDDNYTIPAYAHKFLYREGYVFAGWSYDGNTYASGEVISGLTEDPTITPTWAATTQSLTTSAAETEVSWTFNKSDIVFMDWQNTTNYGYYTLSATVNGENIAVPMKITLNDGETNGKVGNYNRSDSFAQMNKGTVITIPAITGMTVVMTASANISTTTVGGNTPTSGSGSKEATYNYTGANGTVDIAIKDGSGYSSIVVTYPALTVAQAITGAEWATFVPTSKVSVPTGVKAYIVTATTASAATLSDEGAITVIDANTPVILNGTEGTYYFPITTADASDVTGNKLMAGPLSDSDGTNYYVLGKEGSKVGFGLLASGTALPATKAYIPASEFAGAPAFVPFFFGETTGVNTVSSKTAAVNGEVYNLNGQRVTQPTKGLYIVGGKKVIFK